MFWGHSKLRLPRSRGTYSEDGKRGTEVFDTSKFSIGVWSLGQLGSNAKGLASMLHTVLYIVFFAVTLGPFVCSCMSSRIIALA